MLAVATFALASTLGGPAIGSHHHASDLVGRMNANEMPAPAFGRASVLAALEAMRAGQPVVVTDDEDRENEGDLILAGELATAENIGFIVRYASGLICVGLPGDRCDALRLPPMVVNNEDPKCTAFTVSIDYKVGTTTGISAADRAATFRALANADASPDDFSRPGHVFPLRAVPGGVLEREGHTEASVDLCRLAGLKEVGVLCEIVNDDGSSAPPARPPATPAADARARSAARSGARAAAPALLQGARARAHVDRRHQGVHPGNAGQINAP